MPVTTIKQLLAAVQAAGAAIDAARADSAQHAQDATQPVQAGK